MDATSVKRFIGWFVEGLSESLAIAMLRGLRAFEASQSMGLPERISADVPLRVLVLGAHPDDESLHVGGGIATHLQRGDRVTVAIVTHGGGSRAGGLSPQEMIVRRADELRAAIDALGGPTLVPLGLAEHQWSIELAEAKLEPYFAEADVIYAHGPVDYHPDHLRVAQLIARLAKARQRVMLFETQTLLTPLLVNRQVPLNPMAHLAKREAVARHRTQAYTVAASLRRNDLVNRCYRSPSMEVFWELSPEALRNVVAAMPVDSARTPYRGIRYRGYTDPLGVLAGTWARLRLRRIVVDAPHAE